MSLSLFVWLACGTLGMQRSSTARTGVLLRSYWLKVGWVTQGLSVSCPPARPFALILAEVLMRGTRLVSDILRLSRRVFTLREVSAGSR